MSTRYFRERYPESRQWTVTVRSDEYGLDRRQGYYLCIGSPIRVRISESEGWALWVASSNTLNAAPTPKPRWVSNPLSRRMWRAIQNHNAAHHGEVNDGRP